MKRSERLIGRTIEEEEEIEMLICHLGLDYFFIGVIEQPICPPTVMTILVLWNKEFHYYNERAVLRISNGKART
jgi:hypothetical protein